MKEKGFILLADLLLTMLVLSILVAMGHPLTLRTGATDSWTFFCVARLDSSWKSSEGQLRDRSLN
jgi:hypothetical protein